MAEKKQIKTSEVTPAQIAEWKKQYGEGRCLGISVVDPKDGSVKKVYLRPPTRIEMGAYAKVFGDNSVRANEYLMKQCWLAGDEEIIKDDDLFYAAAAHLPELIRTGESTLERL